MTIKIIQVTDGGADEFNSVEAWVEHWGVHGYPGLAGLKSNMLELIDAMPSGTVASFGGGWVLKDVKEVEFR